MELLKLIKTEYQEYDKRFGRGTRNVIHAGNSGYVNSTLLWRGRCTQKSQ